MISWAFVGVRSSPNELNQHRLDRTSADEHGRMHTGAYAIAC